MATVRMGEVGCRLSPGESVLEGLERCGVAIASSCRSGACQSCVVQATRGAIPAAAQSGLKETWKRRGYFLACVCRLAPGDELEVQPIGEAEDVGAEVAQVERLSPTVTRLRLSPDRALSYEPGQFVTLIRGDGLARSYSLASLADAGYLELHVRWIAGGRMSTWVHEAVRAGQRVTVRGPHGECFYTGGEPEQRLLLVGTGTGLAPLWGIAREALRRGHRGPITLIHGARDPRGLYLRDELTALERANEPFEYIPCALDRAPGNERAERTFPEDGAPSRHAGPSGEPIDGVRLGAIDAVVRGEIAERWNPSATRAYLCGDPDVVRKLKRSLFLAGMSLGDIFSDEFITAAHGAPGGARSDSGESAQGSH